ncbi:DUF1156 domain-containing protein [Deinococcus seoulensis]|nr:DUF1156 domain-containing protein [Deinococcus seoulensis]
MAYKRLIEHRLPLAEISTESAREKSIRHGHISTLHIWWARRPLAASRAAVFATLVPDTDENYELVKKIVPWEAVKDGNNEDILEARRRVLEANGGVPPKVLDPFGGGGAIPLEALRLGCEVYSLDLNPVAHIIQKATLEFPQKYGQPNSRPVPDYIREKDRQVQAEAQGKVSTKNKGKATRQVGFDFSSSEGLWEQDYKKNPLATDVRYWGEWVLEKARAELAEFYPPDEDGKVPVAYLWARTVACTNPACRAEVPMVKQQWLAQKPGRKSAYKLISNPETRNIEAEVVGVSKDEKWPSTGTVEDGNATCPVCGTTITVKDVRQQAAAKTWGQKLLVAITTDSSRSGKIYRKSIQSDAETFAHAQKNLEDYLIKDPLAVPNEPMQGWRREIRPPIYGITSWREIFNDRQLLSISTFINFSKQAEEKVSVSQSKEYSIAIATYLGIIVDRLADRCSMLCRWDNGTKYETIINTFSRQAIPMVWDYAEVNPLNTSSGGWEGAVEWVERVIVSTSKSSTSPAKSIRGSATRLPFDDGEIDAIITDPPYYDAISYAELSDFFYVWMKRSIGHNYPEHFRTPLTLRRKRLFRTQQGTMTIF